MINKSHVALRQLSSRVGKIIALSRGKCDVQLTDGRIFKSVHFAYGYTWPIGSWVTIERVETDWQVIGRGPAASEVFIPTEEPVEPQITGEWIQALANPGLTRSVISAIVNPSAGAIPIFTGTSNFSATPLGLILLQGGIAITAQALQSGLTWVTLRLYEIPIGGGSPTTFDVSITVSPSFFSGYEWIWSNSDGSLVFLSLGGHNQSLFRKRTSAFVEITLTSLGSRTLDGTSGGIPLGNILLGSYQRSYSGDVGTDWYTGPSVTYADGIVSPDYEKILGYLCDSPGTSFAPAFQVNPTALLGLTNPIVFQCSGPFPALTNRHVVWVSGRERLGFQTYADQGLARGYGNPATDSETSQLRTDKFSKQLVAKIVSLNSVTGAPVWEHTLNVSSPTPIEDVGLLDPLTNWISATCPTIMSGDPLNFIGRHTQNSITCNNSFGSGNTTIINWPSLAGSFTVPQFNVFYRTGIQLLPKLSSNTAMPVDYGGGQLRNTHVFHDYAVDDYVSDVCISQGGGLVTCLDHTYFAYLKPTPMLLAGHTAFNAEIPTFGDLGNTSGVWGELGIVTVIGSGIMPDPVTERRVGHLPDIVMVANRYLRKVDSAGVLVWETDLSQLQIASWYMRADELGNLGDTVTVVGGNSAATIPLADNIWKIVPCGRVVFVLADVHDLGPNFMPTTKCMILRDSDGALLHTIDLYLTSQILAYNVYATESFTEFFVGDGSTYIFSLPNIPVISITEVRVNSIPTSDWFQSGDSVEFTVTPNVGDNIEVDYTYQGNLEYRAGDRRYGVNGGLTEIRAGKGETDSEWAAVFVSQTDRTTGSSVPRTWIIEVATNLVSSPTVTLHVPTPVIPSSVAIASGQLFQLEFAGTWNVKKV